MADNPRSLTLAARLLCSAAALMLPGMAMANPVGGQVTAGSATIAHPNATTTNVTQQSEKAIIDWKSFSIAPGETTAFAQPDAHAITLNRVTGVDPSSIMGNLTANGQVWLINPNGIAFGKSAHVDVSGLLATTIDITDQDFMSGNYQFSGLKDPSAMVTNAGHITIRDAGLGALVAPGVENSGVIEADLGQVQLSSTAAFTVDFYGDGLFNITLDKQVTQAIKKQDGTAPSAAVTNSGTLIAKGGKILLTANAAASVVNNAIDMTGYAQATSASQSQDGTITLDGGSDGTVQVAGTLDASGKNAGETGGTVQVTGHDVQLASTAKLDVSGDAGGGTALIGGDMHGGGSLAHASTTSVASGATINADAISKGDGGKVVVWSDDQTDYQGSISAEGGTAGGNGGSAEVSSHGLLNFSGLADLRAPEGTWGALLLDPENVTIQATGSDTVSASSGSTGTMYAGNTDNSILTVSTLENALSLANVTVSTGASGSQAGDITIASNVAWDGPISPAGTTLTLSAYRNIVFNSGVTISTIGFYDNLVLRADNTGTGTGTVIFNSGSGIDFGSDAFGSVLIYYNSAGGYTNPTDFSPYVGLRSDASMTTYMLVNNVNDLQNINENLSGDYALGKDIDASATATWNSGAGFIPIGGPASSFLGILNGDGHTISGLTIQSTDYYVGLIGRLEGTLENINVVNAAVSATVSHYSTSLNYVGGLVGYNDGVIKNVTFTGDVVANVGYSLVGGIAGENFYTIEAASAAGTVSCSGGTAGSECGGLVGNNNGLITTSHADGAVSGDNGVDVGGLVSGNIGVDAIISQSYATGIVTAGPNGNDRAGGLVAVNSSGASVVQSYATGNVNGTAANATWGSIGGLVGENDGESSISESYAVGHVSSALASAAVGGLVGYSVSNPPTTNSYWDIDTTGQATSVAGTGLTDTQLKSGLPSGFNPAVWAIDPNLNSGYPYLLQNAPQNAAPPPPPPPPVLGTVTWSVADATSTYGALATLGAVSLSGVSPSDSGNVDGSVALFSDQSLTTPVTLSAGLDAGTYYEAVTGLTGSAADNYTLSSTDNTLGTLTIDPKTLTWSVADATSAYGTVPTLGLPTFYGLVGSDEVSGIVDVFKGATMEPLSASLPIGVYSEEVVGFNNPTGNYVLASNGNAFGKLIVKPAATTLSSLSAQIANPIPPAFNMSATTPQTSQQSLPQSYPSVATPLPLSSGGALTVQAPSALPQGPPLGGLRGTLTLQLATGQTVQLKAYSNGSNEGSLEAQYQCTDLIVQYASVIGLSNITSQTLGNAKDVASNLVSNSNGQFQYVSGASAASLPSLGAVLSVGAFTGDPDGHVGIVQSVTENSDGTYTVTLFDQNFPDQVPTPHWTKITFTQENGTWSGTMRNTNEYGTQMVPVVGWANPAPS